MIQGVSRCGEKRQSKGIRKLIWSVAEAAGTQLDGRIAGRPDGKVVPGQIDGSRKDVMWESAVFCAVFCMHPIFPVLGSRLCLGRASCAYRIDCTLCDHLAQRALERNRLPTKQPYHHLCRFSQHVKKRLPWQIRSTVQRWLHEWDCCTQANWLRRREFGCGLRS